MYVLSVILRDLSDPLWTPGVRSPADYLDSDDRPLRLDAGLPGSYDWSVPESGPWRLARRANGDRWSSSLSKMPTSTGTELASDSDVWIVVAD